MEYLLFCDSLGNYTIFDSFSIAPLEIGFDTLVFEDGDTIILEHTIVDEEPGEAGFFKWGRWIERRHKVLIDSVPSLDFDSESIRYVNNYKDIFDSTIVNFCPNPDKDYVIHDEYLVFVDAFDYDWCLAKIRHQALPDSNSYLDDYNYAIIYRGNLRFPIDIDDYTTPNNSHSRSIISGHCFVKKIDNFLTVLSYSQPRFVYSVFDTLGNKINEATSEYYNFFLEVDTSIVFIDRISDSLYISEKKGSEIMKYQLFDTLNCRFDFKSGDNYKIVMHRNYRDTVNITGHISTYLFDLRDTIELISKNKILEHAYKDVYLVRFFVLDDNTARLDTRRVVSDSTSIMLVEEYDLNTGDLIFKWPQNPEPIVCEYFETLYLEGYYIDLRPFEKVHPDYPRNTLIRLRRQ